MQLFHSQCACLAVCAGRCSHCMFLPSFWVPSLLLGPFFYFIMVSKYSSSSGVIFVISLGVSRSDKLRLIKVNKGFFAHICAVLYRCYTSLLWGQFHRVGPQSNSWDLRYISSTLHLNLHWIL